LHAALDAFRAAKGFGRAIAAPQIGIGKRFICVNLGAVPFVLINPQIYWQSGEQFEVWDDCLSVPDVIVRVRRHRSISVRFLDEKGRAQNWEHLPEAMSELMQHEIDHLDGIMMTRRALDQDSIRPIAERETLIERAPHRLSLSAIAEATRIIDPAFRGSPQFECESLSGSLGCRLLLKVETANPIRCFKGRGANYFLETAIRATALGGQTSGPGRVVCASAGNFGMAMAYGCRRAGVPVTVFVSRNASAPKVRAIRELGADVQSVGEDFDAAKAAARAFSDRGGHRMVEDGLEKEISEGAGTIGVELLDSGETLDHVLVPLGNGALITGVARWVKASRPWIRIIGVAARGADAMERSWRSGRVIETESVSTIADGVAVRVPVPEALEDMKGLVDDVVLVDDGTMLGGVRLLMSKAGLLVEPSGALGVAAILADPERFSGRRVATILTGSNGAEVP
jgi:threonine dehydratase